MTTRALVLGGGGITGIAWETGLIAGLAEAGVDLTAADRIIGTSAGSIVGAQLASIGCTDGLPLAELYRRQLIPPDTSSDAGVPVASVGPRVLATFGLSMLRARGDVERFGRAVGRSARRAADRGRVPSIEERYSQVRLRLSRLDWPDRDLRITAVDAETGRRVVLTPEGDARLEDAVNASCAVPCVYPPIPIGGRTYVDGGLHSGANADLAEGCDVVLAICPLDRAIGPLRSAAQQLSDLGVPHLLITPDEAARAAIGRNVLDPAARPPSARAGHAQAAGVVEQVRELWG